MVLGEKLDFPSDYFGACQSIGVFTAGHAPACAFDELVHRVRRLYYFQPVERLIDMPNGYRVRVMENDGKWQLMEKTKQFPGLPLEDPNKLIRFYAYRVC